MRNKIKPFVLPIAIVVGFMTHQWCNMMAFLMPYVIFSILMFCFCSVDIQSMKPGWMDLCLATFQIAVSLGGYYLTKAISGNEIVAEGILICVLCPVASSTAVVACMLGANREIVTTYTMVGNLMVAFVAPIIFSFIGTHQTMPFVDSFLLILKRVASVLAIPFFISWILQIKTPKICKKIAKYNGISFYLWAIALLITLGQTIHYVITKGDGHWSDIGILAIMAFVICVVHFGFGKWLGSKFGDTMAGGQLLGQKNSSMGIWMSNMYLNPLASCILAFYSIMANSFNSWQIWYYNRDKK
ncbi:MAG: hypothetical protein MJZ93_00165 [Paludibacteraceae bacterium]|nr:hypothetical protein [Paludibacteraceae bacterium]